MIRSSVAAALAMAIALVPAIARADAYADLLKVKAAFDATTSWHAVMQRPAAGGTIVVEHVAPDRWRVQPAPMMTAYIIGKDVTLEANGTKIPVAPSLHGAIHQMIDQVGSAAASDEVKNSAKDLGTQTLNGQTVHAYSFTSGPATVTISVDANMLPVQSVVTGQQGTVTVTYSQYNDSSIVIQP